MTKSFDVYSTRITTFRGHWGDGTSAIWHLKGNLQPSGCDWSCSQRSAYGEEWYFALAMPPLAHVKYATHVHAETRKRYSLGAGNRSQPRNEDEAKERTGTHYA